MSAGRVSSLVRSLATLFVCTSLVAAQDTQKPWYDEAAPWKSCYMPDGSQATKPQWAPCSKNQADPLSGICCATNRTIASGGVGKDEFSVADVCLDNGVCMNRWQDESGNVNSKYFRAYCTQKDFASGKCLNICRASNSGWSKMTPCSASKNSTLWCCGDSTDCCNQGLQAEQGLRPISLDAKFQTTAATSAISVPTQTPSSSSSTSTPASASSTPTASGSAVGSAAKTPTDTETGLSTGAKAGVGIGAAIGVLLLLALVFLLFRRRKAKQAKSHPAELPYQHEVEKYRCVQPPGVYAEARAEKDPAEAYEEYKGMRYEIDTQESAIEMPDTSKGGSDVKVHIRPEDDVKDKKTFF